MVWKLFAISAGLLCAGAPAVAAAADASTEDHRRALRHVTETAPTANLDSFEPLVIAVEAADADPALDADVAAAAFALGDRAFTLESYELAANAFGVAHTNAAAAGTPVQSALALARHAVAKMHHAQSPEGAHALLHTAAMRLLPEAQQGDDQAIANYAYAYAWLNMALAVSAANEEAFPNLPALTSPDALRPLCWSVRSPGLESEPEIVGTAVVRVTARGGEIIDTAVVAAAPDVAGLADTLNESVKRWRLRATGPTRCNQTGVTYHAIDIEYPLGGNPVSQKAPDGRFRITRWLEKPTGDAFLKYYPERALKYDVSGAAIVCCVPTRDGRLHCPVGMDTPENYGFASAARAIAESSFRLSDSDVQRFWSNPAHYLQVPIMFRSGIRSASVTNFSKENRGVCRPVSAGAAAPKAQSPATP